MGWKMQGMLPRDLKTRDIDPPASPEGPARPSGAGGAGEGARRALHSGQVALMRSHIASLSAWNSCPHCRPHGHVKMVRLCERGHMLEPGACALSSTRKNQRVDLFLCHLLDAAAAVPVLDVLLVDCTESFFVHLECEVLRVLIYIGVCKSGL
jgi:hypothetical protein